MCEGRRTAMRFTMYRISGVCSRTICSLREGGSGRSTSLGLAEQRFHNRVLLWLSVGEGFRCPADCVWAAGLEQGAVPAPELGTSAAPMRCGSSRRHVAYALESAGFLGPSRAETSCPDCTPGTPPCVAAGRLRQAVSDSEVLPTLRRGMLTRGVTKPFPALGAGSPSRLAACMEHGESSEFATLGPRPRSYESVRSARFGRARFPSS